MGFKVVNKFFEWANNFSYELYLVHSLAFVVTAYLLSASLPVPALLVVGFVMAYGLAYGYKWLLVKSKLVK